ELHRVAGRRRHVYEPVGQISDAGWTIDIRRLAPALATADHAAGDDGQPALLEPGADEPVEGTAEIAIGDLHDAGRRLQPVDDRAAGVDAVSAKARRAPVERDQRRVAHPFTRYFSMIAGLGSTPRPGSCGTAAYPSTIGIGLRASAREISLGSTQYSI